MANYWDPTKTDAKFSLSSSNQVATCDSSGTDQSVISEDAASIARYCEIEIIDFGEYNVLGVCNSSHAAGDRGGFNNNSWSWMENGRLYHESSYTTTTTDKWGSSPATVLMIAVDPVNNKVWFGFDGSWCDGGDPAAGTGEQFSDAGITGDIFVCYSVRYAGDSVQLRVLDSEFSYSPPSGFYGWGEAVPDNVSVAGHFTETEALATPTTSISLSVGAFTETESLRGASHIAVAAGAFAETESLIGEGLGPGFFVEAGHFSESASIRANMQTRISAGHLTEAASLSASALEIVALIAAGHFQETGALFSGITAIIIGEDIVDTGFLTFRCVLTGSADGLPDIELPFESFQSRLRTGKPSYLQVVIKGTEYADEISARSNGNLIVKMGVIIDGDAYLMEPIAEVELEDIEVHKGANSTSITLVGHQTETYSNSKTVKVSDVSYKRTKGADITIRTPVPRFFLNPGDTVVEQHEGDSFVAGLITHTLSASSLQTEITSRSI